jgi:hypothetical protein
MKIKDLHLEHLRNPGHVQFHTDAIVIVKKYNPATLSFESELADYELKFDDEKQAFVLIRKSAKTEDITHADQLRDDTNKGLRGMVKANLYHFNPLKKAAAKRLKVVIDVFGDIIHKEYNEASGSYTEMLDELQNKHAADVTLLGLDEWLTELRANNNNFIQHMGSRYEEGAAKTTLRMKEVRLLVDAAYVNMVEQIHALMRVNGAAAYEPLVAEMNQLVDKYNLILAQRQGRADAGDTNEGNNGEGEPVDGSEVTPVPIP